MFFTLQVAFSRCLNTVRLARRRREWDRGKHEVLSFRIGAAAALRYRLSAKMWRSDCEERRRPDGHDLLRRDAAQFEWAVEATALLSAALGLSPTAGRGRGGTAARRPPPRRPPR